MKKSVSLSLFGATFAALVFAMLTACGSKTEHDAYQFASADDMIVAQVAPADFYANAGCDIKDGSATITKALRNLSETTGLHFLQAKGIALDHDVLITVREKNTVAVAFTISSHADFKEYLHASGTDFSESNEGGYTVYRLSRSSAIFCNGASALLLCNDHAETSLADFEAFKAQAADKPLKQWQQKALDNDGAINIVARTAMISELPTAIIGLDKLGKIYDREALKHGYFKFSGSVKGLEAAGEGVFTDSAGNTIKGKIDKLADTSLLKYANSSQMAAIMLAVPGDFDWNDVLASAGRSPQLRSVPDDAKQALVNVLKDVDGTIMLAAGPKSMMGMQSAKEWSVTLAAQFKKDKADEQLAQIKNILSSNKINYSAVNENGTVAVTFNGEVSSEGGFAIPSRNLDGMCAAFALDVPRDNIFSSLIAFPFGLRVVYGTDGTTLSFSAKLTECDGLFLENIIDLLSAH